MMVTLPRARSQSNAGTSVIGALAIHPSSAASTPGSGWDNTDNVRSPAPWGILHRETGDRVHGSDSGSRRGASRCSRILLSPRPDVGGGPWVSPCLGGDADEQDAWGVLCSLVGLVGVADPALDSGAMAELQIIVDDGPSRHHRLLAHSWISAWPCIVPAITLRPSIRLTEAARVAERVAQPHPVPQPRLMAPFVRSTLALSRHLLMTWAQAHARHL